MCQWSISFRVCGQHRLSPDESVIHRQRQLLKLEEDRLISAYMAEVMQNRRQAWIGRQVKFKVFQKDDWVMMYNSKLGPHPGKLKLQYFGPYQITEELGQGTFRLKDMFGTPIQKPVNGFRLKKFYGHVPEIPKWMVNKARDVGVRFVGVDFAVQKSADSEWCLRSHLGRRSLGNSDRSLKGVCLSTRLTVSYGDVQVEFVEDKSDVKRLGPIKIMIKMHGGDSRVVGCYYESVSVLSTQNKAGLHDKCVRETDHLSHHSCQRSVFLACWCSDALNMFSDSLRRKQLVLARAIAAEGPEPMSFTRSVQPRREIFQEEEERFMGFR